LFEIERGEYNIFNKESRSAVPNFSAQIRAPAKGVGAAAGKPP
jgi:hypothetical protein